MKLPFFITKDIFKMFSPSKVKIRGGGSSGTPGTWCRGTTTLFLNPLEINITLMRERLKLI